MKISEKKRVIGALCLVLSLSVTFTSSTLIVGCGKTASEEDLSMEEKSNEYLRDALVALDEGKEVEAERLLKLCLQYNPQNTEAEIHLSSLYAKQAGIKVSDWLDPLYDSIEELEDRAQYLKAIAETIREGGIPDTSNGVEESDISSNESLEKSQKIVTEIFQLSSSVLILAKIFNAVPNLSDESLQKLDKSIDVLRKRHISPLSRPEESRVYLAILSVIRLVNYTKRLVGDHIADFNFDKNRMCALDSDGFRNKIYEIKRSLRMMEEGLTVHPEAEATSLREARSQLRGFITDILKNNIWLNLDNMLNPDAPEGKLAKQIVRKNICK